MATDVSSFVESEEGKRLFGEALDAALKEVESAQESVPMERRASREVLEQTVGEAADEELWGTSRSVISHLMRLRSEMQSIEDALRAEWDQQDRSQDALLKRTARGRPHGSVDEQVGAFLRRDPRWARLDRESQNILELIKATLQLSISALLRSKVNELIAAGARRYDALLHTEKPEALLSKANEETRVATDPRSALDDFVQQTERASIGVAGPRGCGKSTLIEEYTTEDSKTWRGASTLHIHTQAPVKYVPREFLLHLYAKICQAVLSQRSSGGIDINDPVQPPTDRGAERSARAARVVSVLAAASGTALLLRYASAPGLSSGPRLTAFSGAAATVGIALLATWLIFVDRSTSYTRYSHLARDCSMRRWPSPRTRYLALALVLAGATALLAGRGTWAWLTPTRASGIALLLAGGLTFPRLVRPAHRALGGDERAAWEWLQVMEHSIVLAIGAVAAQITAVASGLALILLPTSASAPDAQLVAGTLLLSAGGSALNAGLAFKGLVDNITRAGAQELAHPAFVTLQRIRYQRTATEGWTSALKMGGGSWSPFSVEAGMSGAVTEAETPMDTPDIIEGINYFLWRYNGHAFIGIDELDKIESPEEARTFLNEIKGVLQAPETHFIISISEDAIASFERRGMPFRDVFDSAFDEVVSVTHLSAQECRELLDRRLIGIPPSFMALGYCLSGGLARDLGRVMYRMISTAERTGERTLTEVTRQVVHEEMSAKTDAVSAALKPLPLEPDVSKTISSLRRMDGCASSRASGSACVLDDHWLSPLQELKADPRISTPAEDVADQRTLVRLTAEMASFHYYSRTLLELFQNTDDNLRHRLIATVEGNGGQALDDLAHARQDFALNPYVAWDRISAFREDNGLAPFDHPL